MKTTIKLKDYVNIKYENFEEKKLFILEDENEKPIQEHIVDCTSYLVRNNLQRKCELLQTLLDKDIIILKRSVF